MNLCLFFEGTGRGVAGKVTNVTRLRDICVDDVRQMCRTARLSQKLDASAVVLHDAHDEASNLWGAFDRARRNLPRLTNTMGSAHGNNQPVLSLRPLRSLRLKHQSRVGSFSVERGNAFYTIYTFYTAIICVGLRNDCFWAVR